MESRKTEKMIIYQVFPRWFGNTNTKLVRNGSLAENGTGKFSDFTPLALSKIKELGTTHIWYTGVIEHATQTDYTAYHIQKDHTAVVKGKAGSPYAIKDYYDIDPDLADHVEDRMEEFEALVARTHEAGMKVIIDFVPNHVARQYHSDAQYNFIEELGQNDNTSKAFDPNNNFYYIPGQPLTLPFTDDDDGLEYSEFPAKATGNDRFDAFPNCNDWYETVKLNYGVDYLNGSIRSPTRGIKCWTSSASGQAKRLTVSDAIWQKWSRLNFGNGRFRLSRKIIRLSSLPKYTTRQNTGTTFSTDISIIFMIKSAYMILYGPSFAGKLQPATFQPVGSRSKESKPIC